MYFFKSIAGRIQGGKKTGAWIHLPNDHLEVKKVNSVVDSYVSDIEIVRMDSPCGRSPRNNKFRRKIISKVKIFLVNAKIC